MADKYSKIKRIKVNGTNFDVDFTPIGYVTSPNGTDFTLKVDNEGNLFTVDESKIPAPLTPPTTPGQTLAKLYINSFYCGGKDADEHTLNYCSHNFVELSNLTNNDINLKGLSLQYTINGSDWQVLPLEGVIKAGSTFVVRGAQCSLLESPLLKINVDKYDQEWYTSDGKLISFDSEASAKFYLAFTLTKYAGVNPYKSTDPYVQDDAIGYVDLVGVQGTGSPEGFEKAVYNVKVDNIGLSNSKLYKKYYSMDGVKQATKAMSARSNANDWCFVDLSKNDGDLIPCIEVYRPMASNEGKNLFYDKTKLSKTKPSVVTCSFGRQATDNGNGATRCFNWITGNINNKYIWIRTSGSATWDKCNAQESFCKNDGRTAYASDKERKVYDRIMKEYTDKTVIIVNKFIISGLSAGSYEYVVGSKDSEGAPKAGECTEIRSFIVRSDTEVNAGFSFCQTSDQQGFNWDEYQVWDATSKCIEKEYGNQIHFMMNTGDMTQNGNRINEWIDYFDAKSDYFNNMEEVATIGNNDLSLNVLYMIGDGEDGSKLWHENFTFFYTLEIDPNNAPIFAGPDGNEYFIPSLYSFNYGKAHFMSVNTEIKKKTETDVYGYNFGEGNYGNFYPHIKTWCEADIEPYSADTNVWKIVFCHEMPFTILTPAVAQSVTEPAKRSGGSNSNENVKSATEEFWLSEFCQTHGIKLCLGGHKHTEASSWQILENVQYADGVRSVDSMHPIIVLSSASTSDFYIGKFFTNGDSDEKDTGATELIEYTFEYVPAEATGTTREYTGFYPNNWFDKNGDDYILKPIYSKMVNLCTFKMEEDLEEGVVPVVYAMSQASSYKHTSNKELPSKNIPWLRYYYPAGGTVASPSVDKAQRFPFFTVWTLSGNTINGNVRKAYGVYNNETGKFDINVDYPYTKRGYSTVEKDNITKIHSINGITTMTTQAAEIDTRIITINK